MPKMLPLSFKASICNVLPNCNSLQRNYYNIFRKLSSFSPKFEVLFEKARIFQDKTAVIDRFNMYKYRDLYYYSDKFGNKLSERVKCEDKRQVKVGFLCPSDITYLITQWSCWMRGYSAVPLCSAHPPSQLEYFIKDSDCNIIVTTKDFYEILDPISQNLKIPIIKIQHPNETGEIVGDIPKYMPPKSKNFKKQPALFVYTSGTTGLPKGVVLTHENLYSQACSVNHAWEIKPSDIVIHALPLHHLHGILNGLISPLLAGASVVLLPKFSSEEIWKWFLGEKSVQPTIFHGVPTMYSLLIDEMKNKYPSKDTTMSRTRDYVKAYCKTNMRFMACGSASLPKPIWLDWKKLTGHFLLERYGMTELGMVFTNSLHGKRISGCVGKPFPGTKVRIGKPNFYSGNEYDTIVEGDSHGSRVTPGQENEIGELLVKGPNVFQEYWNQNRETERSFTKDGWFKTGDIAQYVNENYRILGRKSVDIIKSGGYKISALDIECQLLANSKIKECAVVGLPDVTWGEKVVAVIVANEEITLEELRVWCKDKLPSYSIPTSLTCLQQLPRNLLGKVNKIELVKQIFPDARKSI